MADPRFICRSSQMGNLLSKDQSRKAGTFGKTAKDVIIATVLSDVFGYIKPTGSKYTEKGIMLEDNSIELLNNLYFTNYQKNEKRITDDWFTGECDILADDHIRDVKTVWSLDSLPMTEAQALAKVKAGGYYEQGQIYMHLFERDVHYVDFILLPTPLDQLKYADEQEIFMLHELPKQMPIAQRVTTVRIERDDEAIKEYKERVEQSQELYLEIYNEASKNAQRIFKML